MGKFGDESMLAEAVVTERSTCAAVLDGLASDAEQTILHSVDRKIDHFDY